MKKSSNLNKENIKDTPKKTSRATKTDCIFCKIGTHQIPASVLYETNDIIAFLDMKPIQPGHTLVIPKNHFRWMDTTPDELVATVYIEAKKIMAALKKTMKADYVSVLVMGEEVPHFHVHLIPRYLDDKLKLWPRKKYVAGEMETLAKKIQKKV